MACSRQQATLHNQAIESAPSEVRLLKRLRELGHHGPRGDLDCGRPLEVLLHRAQPGGAHHRITILLRKISGQLNLETDALDHPVGTRVRVLDDAQSFRRYPAPNAELVHVHTSAGADRRQKKRERRRRAQVGQLVGRDGERPEVRVDARSAGKIDDHFHECDLIVKKRRARRATACTRGAPPTWLRRR